MEPEGVRLLYLASGKAISIVWPNAVLQRDAHTSDQIKYGTQLSGKYVEVSTPELDSVRISSIKCLTIS